VTSAINRYYDPSTDQFLSIDPDVTTTDQPYVFTNDDPLNYDDPLGLKDKPKPTTINLVVSVAAGSAIAVPLKDVTSEIKIGAVGPPAIAIVSSNGKDAEFAVSSKPQVVAIIPKPEQKSVTVDGVTVKAGSADVVFIVLSAPPYTDGDPTK
jgi:hypothetical protein